MLVAVLDGQSQATDPDSILRSFQMRITSLAASILLLGSPICLAAGETPAGRFTLTPSASGYVRLDTQTGQVSECSGEASKLVCKSSPDERAALQAEIDRLQAKLEAQASAAPASADQKSLEFNIPADKDVDKAFNFLERMIKRFKGLIEDLRKEPGQSTPL
jgi:hypothetical protein